MSNQCVVEEKGERCKSYKTRKYSDNKHYCDNHLNSDAYVRVLYYYFGGGPDFGIPTKDEIKMFMPLIKDS